MPVCPECGNAHLGQSEDKHYMVCDAGHVFFLIKVPVEIKDRSKADKVFEVLVKVLAILLAT